MNDCIVKMPDLLQKSAELGYSGVAITDHDCLSSAVKALEYVQDIKQNYPNFKLVLGNEIYLNEEQPIDEIPKFYHFLLLARTEKGFEYLKQLSTRAWYRGKVVRGILRVPTFYSDIEEIVQTKGDLVASSACLGSFLASCITQYIEEGSIEARNKAISFVNWGKKVFGEEYFYIEIQSSINEEQVAYNKKALQLAKLMNVKVILTEDVHYLVKEDKNIHKAFVDSTRSSNNEDDNTKDFYEGCYLKPEDELRERLSYLSDEQFCEVCQNTVNILDTVEEYSIKQNTIVPLRKLPEFSVQGLFEQWYNDYPSIKYCAHSEYDQDRFLLSEIEKGFLDRKQEFNQVNIKRINDELDVVLHISEELGQRLSAYYNLMQVILNIIWEKGDSLVGIARGSATAFYILYLIGVTQINPIIYNLPYFRHLNYARAGAMADVDTDSESSKRGQIIEAMRDYFGEEHFLNIATFKTETSRSAVLTCCRGMDIPPEIAQEIVDTIPVVRGMNYSINDCLYGGEEKEPSPLFKKAIESHPGLLEACLKIEGLISGVGIHASGVAITNDSYVKQTSCMRAPNGTLITAFDLGDCEKVGIIKYDLLTVSTLDEIRTTLNLLLKDGLIEDKGSLRATYNAYLHPDVLDYTTPEMFALLGTNKATNIFQLSTNMSMQACKMLHPKSLMEMTLVNSVIRLAGEHGKESPTDKYVRYKNNPEEWYKDLRDYGLNENEIKILERHLKNSSGLCLSQETLMLMSMDKEISGMTLAESDTLRKAISKKKHKLVVQSKETFYKRGMENDVRKIFLDYVWEEQFSLSLSYSFALSHGVAYSCIGLQQLNLLYHYPAIYSQCATLLVNSSSSEDSVGNKIDYGKIASAASFAQKQGIRFAPPDINKADRGFTPDAKNSIIYCGLKNICAINEEKASAIIENRNTGYTSLNDFLSKNDVTKIQTISLIKAGAFDNLYKGYPRQKILQGYVSRLVNETIEDKTSLSASNIDNILSMNLLPEEYKIYGRYYNFNKFITQKNFVAEKINNRVWLIAKDIAVPFFEQHYLHGLQEKKEYFYTAEGIMFSKAAYSRLYKTKMEKVLTFINTPDFLRKYNLAVKNASFRGIWDKYCQGTTEDWEFDSLKFYIGDSPLKKINSQKYNISSFDLLPEKPVVEEEFQWKGQTCYKYRTSRICGTVLDCNRTKHLVTLLTPEKEVVEVKFYAGAFIHYNKVIKETSSSGETICDNSWFTRGNKLMIAGYRSGDMFRPKKYKDGIYRHTVALIDSIDQTGNVVLRELRLGEKENEWSGY